MRIVRPLLTAAAFAALCAPALGAEILPLPHFDGVGLKGGGHVTLKYGTEQRVTLISGTTKFTHIEVNPGGGLNIDACDWNCPHNYDLEIEIVSPDVHAVAIQGGGEIVAQGTFPASGHLSAAVSGGGDIDTRAIPSTKVSAAVNGGGTIKLAASETLRAAVNGGGSIVYWGNPELSEAVVGGGDVRRAQ